MLSATNLDGPTFHTRSRTAQSDMTENNTSYPKTDTTTPDITKIRDHQMPCQNHLPKIDYKHYYRCREQIHSVSTSPSTYEMEKHLNMKLISFYTSKDYCTNITDSNQKLIALVIPKSWKYTVLVEAHGKLGHQGATHTNCLVKCQYYWKGMNKDIRKYIAYCTLYHREKAKVQSYP